MVLTGPKQCKRGRCAGRWCWGAQYGPAKIYSKNTHSGGVSEHVIAGISHGTDYIRRFNNKLLEVCLMPSRQLSSI